MQEEGDLSYSNTSSWAIHGSPRRHPVKDDSQQGIQDGVFSCPSDSDLIGISIHLVKRYSCIICLLGSTRWQLDIK
uniref:Uncharacterized protein n=1 Tax=Romanomermis culicivorax TaxID=13658 RepID=A0A915II51_ROMCU